MRSAALADELGVSLVHLAVAWVIRNPAVTSAIIGPRTMEQLTTQLGAADLVLTDDVLDRIDEIVPPGTNFSWADAGYVATHDRGPGSAPATLSEGDEPGQARSVTGISWPSIFSTAAQKSSGTGTEPLPGLDEHGDDLGLVHHAAVGLVPQRGREGARTT